MKSFLNAIPAKAWAAMGAVAVALVLVAVFRRDIARAGEALKPTNPANVFHSGVNAVGAAVSQDRDFSLGASIFDLVQKIGGGPTDDEVIGG